MNIYKIQKSSDSQFPSITIIEKNISIPCSPANTDYANFKVQILKDQAQLQDADGNLMSAKDAKAFVKELP